MRTADGTEAFRRVLAVDLGPRVVIHNEPLPDMLARVRRSLADRTADGAPSREPDSGPPEQQDEAPGTELEAALCVAWAETIGVDRVGLDDDFFELGGNSLVAVQLIARVGREAGVRLPMSTLFETPTVGGLAARIEQLRRTESDAGPAQSITRLSRGQ